MLIEKFENNKIVFAYDEWNRKDIDNDNYYVIAYLELYPTRFILKYRDASPIKNEYGCVGDFEENDQYKKVCFAVGLNIDNIDSNLYYSSHVIMDFITEKIAKYDMVCLPFKKKIWADQAQRIRSKHLAKMLNKPFAEIYNKHLETINQRCRMDIYEKAFFSVGGKAHYEKFVAKNNAFVPDFYLGKDILKYRAAAIAFMDTFFNYMSKQEDFTCPIGESYTRMVIPTKWNWRKHMVINVDRLSSGTNKFLDKYPGGVPLKIKLAFNTSREPSRLFLIAQDTLYRFCKRWNSPIDYPELAFKILEKSSDKQIKKALNLLGLSNTRKSSDIADALGIVYDYDPLDYNCTIVGWAKNSIEAHRQENLRSLEEKLEPYKGVDISAPDFPVDFSEHGIKQLKTPEEIIMEGHEMEHCVGTYVKKALSGSSYIFSFKDGDNRATAEVNQFGDIIQVRGVRNHRNNATSKMSSILRNEIDTAIEKKKYLPKKKDSMKNGAFGEIAF